MGQLDISNISKLSNDKVFISKSIYLVIFPNRISLGLPPQAVTQVRRMRLGGHDWCCHHWQKYDVMYFAKCVRTDKNKLNIKGLGVLYIGISKNLCLSCYTDTKTIYFYR